MLAEVLWCLDAIDELLRPSHPLKAPLVAREGTVVKFLRFNGTDDLLRWIHHYECYFHVHRRPEHKRVAYAAFHLLDDAQLWYYRLPDNGGPPTWEQFVLLVAAGFGPQFTGKPLNMPALGGEAVAQEGMDDSSVLFKAASKGDNAMHVDGSSSKHGASNDGILPVGAGDDVMPVDDDNSALCADDDSNVSSNSGDTSFGYWRDWRRQ
jgi:hypothetical protein